MGLLLISGNEENDEAFNFVFNLFDTNGSGNIDIKEAEEVSGRERIDIKPGTSGFCGPRPLPLLIYPLLQAWALFKPIKKNKPSKFGNVDDWFNYVDENGDGTISREEFVKKRKSRLNDVRRNSAFLFED